MHSLPGPHSSVLTLSHLGGKMRRLVVLGGLVALVAAACNSGVPAVPVSPTGTGLSNALADSPGGAKLKATTPAAVSPKDGEEVDSLQPVLVWQNAKGTFRDVDFTYKVELYRENDLLHVYTVPEGGGDQTSFTIPDELEHGTLYRWRVQASYLDGTTPFCVTANFMSPPPPFVPGQPFGPERVIGEHEALALIESFHDMTGADLGPGSTRESRTVFFFSAVAVVAYGHPVFNPKGGDRDWCVKDAGGGRPPSDDALVRCSTREAWDTILGAGAVGYRFHLDYLGVLPSVQNVYSPPLSSLPH